jgi:glycosyltransferase involved in cell wall biosynthesis
MISFIVPAFNEERLLATTLEALHQAGRDCGLPYELIVADDASTDATPDIAARLGARVVRVAHRQIAATRNSGARIAQGDYLIFVDADTVVGSAVVRAALAAMREGGAVGGGAAVSFEGTLPRYARLLVPALAWGYRAARLAAGCFLFCTREAYAAVGGFDETYFGAEEIVMSGALKRHGRFVVLAQTVSTSGRNLRAYSGRELLWISAGIAWRGRKGIRQRRGMDIWYTQERRADPEHEP